MIPAASSIDLMYRIAFQQFTSTAMSTGIRADGAGTVLHQESFQATLTSVVAESRGTPVPVGAAGECPEARTGSYGGIIYMRHDDGSMTPIDSPELLVRCSSPWTISKRVNVMAGFLHLAGDRQVTLKTHETTGNYRAIGTAVGELVTDSGICIRFRDGGIQCHSLRITKAVGVTRQPNCRLEGIHRDGAPIRFAPCPYQLSGQGPGHA